MNKFLDGDNKIRSAKFRKDENNEGFLRDLNTHLSEFDVPGSHDKEEAYPLLFIIGLPRSGTTLLTQLLASCLDIGYVNNVMSKFWLAPVHGIRLSRVLLGEGHYSSFTSEFGKTRELSEPHEFSYFWIHWLKMMNMPPYVPSEVAKEIDWDGMRNTLIAMSHAFGKAFGFKALCPAHHLEKFGELFQKAYFIYVDRDPMDVASSLYKARVEYYNDPDTWWSMYPPEYDKIKDLPYHEQIPAQMHYLEQCYTKPLEGPLSERTYRLSYSELCESPIGVLERIQSDIRGLFGYEIALKQDPPDSFKVKHASIDTPELKKLEQGLKTFY